MSNLYIQIPLIKFSKLLPLPYPVKIRKKKAAGTAAQIFKIKSDYFSVKYPKREITQPATIT